MPKGKRKAREYVEGYKPSTFVVEGWGHPEVASWLEPTQGGGISRHTSYAPEWVTEFNEAFNAVKETVNMLGDFRAIV